MRSRLLAEFVGTGILTCAVVGSGIMATRLTTDVGLQLLLNAIATGAALGVLVFCLLPVSGAHLNPAVTAVAATTGAITRRLAGAYMSAQVLGAILGTALADLMFGLPPWTLSHRQRNGSGVLLGEVIATAGLLVTILVAIRLDKVRSLPILIPAWIVSAYFFTSSTSFANPAVTVGRALTDTFTGIAPADALVFIVMQFIGAFLGLLLVRHLYRGRQLNNRKTTEAGVRQ